MLPKQVQGSHRPNGLSARAADLEQPVFPLRHGVAGASAPPGLVIHVREVVLHRPRRDDARFITGLRNAAGLVAGASGVPVGRFLAVSAVAALAWSALITLEYYFVGDAILGAPTWLQVVLIIVGVVATIAAFRFVRLGIGVRGRRPADAAEVSD